MASKVYDYIDELAESVNPNRAVTSKAGAGGLFLDRDYSNAKDLGSGFRVIIKLCLAIELNDIILIDEPETFLHPSLQHKLASYIMDKSIEGKQFIIATHSEVFLNYFFRQPNCSLHETLVVDNKNSVRRIQANTHVFDILDDLGLKASYLLQSNGIIWVEGPSDRIYIKHWLSLWSNGELIEGEHYDCVCYGGKLLSHYAATYGIEYSDRIEMLRINRNFAILIDSDRKSPTDSLNATKNRLLDEISNSSGFSWVTDGRTIENYLSAEILNSVGLLCNGSFGNYERIEDILATSKKNGGAILEKVKLARLTCKNISRNYLEKTSQLANKLDNLTSEILRWNR